MATEDLRSQIIAALEEEAASHGIDVVDVEIVGATKSPAVRVRIDHADESLDTISLDEVAAQNEWIDAVIERVDPFPNSYTLEVSSPGLARPLRKERDFVRFAGEDVALATNATEGRKRYSGVLQGVRDGLVVVSCDGEDFAFELGQIRSCTIKPKIDFSRKG